MRACWRAREREGRAGALVGDWAGGRPPQRERVPGCSPLTRAHDPQHMKSAVADDLQRLREQRRRGEGERQKLVQQLNGLERTRAALASGAQPPEEAPAWGRPHAPTHARTHAHTRTHAAELRAVRTSAAAAASDASEGNARGAEAASKKANAAALLRRIELFVRRADAVRRAAARVRSY